MPSQTQPHFELVNAAGRRQLVVRSNEPLTIGRHTDNLLVLDDNMVSRFHCVIERTTGGYFIRDLGASNGTLVNGRRVKSIMLSAGDVVTIGKSSLVLVLPGHEGVPPQANVPQPAVIPLEEPVPLDALDELSRPAPGSEVEELSELDVVEEDEEALGWGDVAADDDRIEITHEDDHDAGQAAVGALWGMAEAVPNKPFIDRDIALINPRGQTVHPAGGGGTRTGPPQAVDVLRLLLLAAFRGRATDIHVEPKDDAFLARIRVDGVMVDAARLPPELGGRVLALVKILCDLDPASRPIVQEGGFSARVPSAGAAGFGRAPASAGTRRVDYRVSFAPAVTGQKLVMRVLDPTTVPSHLSDLGLADWLQTELADAVQQDSGMVLVSGPTGSGKTSTLYALVRSIDTAQRNVTTIEDPVEIHLDGATQLPVDEAQGNSFPALLKSVLRQDPDVILVGEVRDSETARIAMQAAITGHLVFTTIHTKDTLGTVFRLLDLGVEPYLLSQGLHLVLAQRLVRQLCPYCKSPRPATEAQLAKMGEAGQGVARVYVPSACRKCLGTGHAGRRAFFEYLRATDELKDAISKAPSRRELQEALTGTSFQRLSHSGYKLVAEGVCSFEEVDRAVGR